MHGQQLETPPKYSISELVGKGAYGVVFSVKDMDTGEDLAVKKIESTFEHVTFAIRTLREIRILRRMNHENVLRIEKIYIPGAKETFDDIYVVSELMQTDMMSILQSSQPFTPAHCKFFIYQVIRGIKYIHSAGIIHRDLKPRNLLVNANCDLKICDFGLARFADNDRDDIYTEYVCTRFYRAPEVICGRQRAGWYSTSMDMWSIGCILGEMHLRKVLFPGYSVKEQLRLAVQGIGRPDVYALAAIGRQACKNVILQARAEPACGNLGIRLAAVDASADTEAFMRSLLQFAPAERPCAADALADPYLKDYACEFDEPTCQRLDPKMFDFNDEDDEDIIREDIYDEMLDDHPDAAAIIQSTYKTWTVKIERRQSVKGGLYQPSPSVGLRLMEVDMDMENEKYEFYTALRVKQVFETGLIAEFNTEKPDDQVKVLDRLIEVNGVKDDAMKMLDQVKQAPQLELIFRRGPKLTETPVVPTEGTTLSLPRLLNTEAETETMKSKGDIYTTRTPTTSMHLLSPTASASLHALLDLHSC